MAKRQPCLMFGSLLFPMKKVRFCQSSATLMVKIHMVFHHRTACGTSISLSSSPLASWTSGPGMGRWPQVTKQGERFIVVYATAARSGLSEFAVFFLHFDEIKCIHTHLLHMISHTFGWGRGGLVTSLCTCSRLWCYVRISFQTVSIQRMRRVNFWMPGTMAIQSSPCLVANGSHSSQSTLQMRRCTCKWHR